MQTTLKSPVTFAGVGLHTGTTVRMTIRPAPSGSGIWFRRVDLAGDQWIAARWDSVVPSTLCTLIENGAGASVSTVEHVMAGLAGTGVSNAVIEIDGPEVPIEDGSAASFVAGILSRGLVQQSGPVLAVEVLKPVSVSAGPAHASIEPSEGVELSFEIDFPDRAIGRQAKSLNLANGVFVRELCDSRTFCRLAEVEELRAKGLILGGTIENAVVIDGDKVMTPGGLRHADEAVRHKMLDAVGDLALAGAPILGHYRGYRAGHALTNRLLRALFAEAGAARMVVCGSERAARLPGVGVNRADLTAIAA